MADEADMNLVVSPCRDHPTHGVVSILVRTLLRDEAEPTGDSKYMSVYRKDRTIAGEQQRAGYGFRADAFEAGEELFGVLQRSGLEK
jgi:hypothetical protein